MGVVRRYIDILIILLIPTPLVLALSCSSILYFFVHFKNVFHSCIYEECEYIGVTMFQRCSAVYISRIVRVV